MILRAILSAIGIALLLPSCGYAQEEPMADWTVEPRLVPHVVLQAYDFQGDVLIERDGNDALMSLQLDYEEGRAWPWASVTKQVIAVMVMQQVEAGKLELDAPASDYLPRFASDAQSPTVRQLLQHQSGLRDPDLTPAGEDGIPSFYKDGPTGIDWCLAERETPAAEGWVYNNCDYIVLGALLEEVTGKTIDALIADRLGTPSGWSNTQLLTASGTSAFVGKSPDYINRISRYGSSAALVGPLEDMLAFNRALRNGDLISDESRAILWESDPALGYMALGQWVFEAPLYNCDAPVRIVERRGNIGKYQTRNFILPDFNFSIALATDQEGFDFHEIWMGSGFAHDLLAAVACG